MGHPSLRKGRADLLQRKQGNAQRALRQAFAHRKWPTRRSDHARGEIRSTRGGAHPECAADHRSSRSCCDSFMSARRVVMGLRGGRPTGQHRRHNPSAAHHLGQHRIGQHLASAGAGRRELRHHPIAIGHEDRFSPFATRRTYSCCRPESPERPALSKLITRQGSALLHCAGFAAASDVSTRITVRPTPCRPVTAAGDVTAKRGGVRLTSKSALNSV